MPTEDDSSFAKKLSSIRHSLRAPAGHIIGYAEMIAEDEGGDSTDEVVRDLQAIATSGERLVAMIEEHLGAANQSIDDLDLSDAQFQLRQQLNHISGYTEMLVETAEDDDREDLITDLARIAAADRRMLQLLEDRLTPEGLAASGTDSFDTSVDTAQSKGEALRLGALAKGGNLLVIDDDPTNRDLLERRLTRFGFEVTTAESGDEGLTAASEPGFDLILMDLMMDGNSGIETLQKLKSSPTTKDIPVIMLSAADDLDQMVDCVLAGADDYLISPIRPILLLARIGASLEKLRLQRRFTRQLRIFISSPGDVIPERRVLKQLIQQLDHEYGHEVQLVPILWEEEPLVASETFQSQIIEPHDTDIYIAILWSRIGSPLPKTILRPDGSQYDSGTAYEFEDAMESFRDHGSPKMLMYRKLGAPTIELTDRDIVMERLDQIDRLDKYVDRWFRGDDGSYIGAFHQFTEPSELETMVSMHLRKLIDRWLSETDDQAIK